MVRNSYGGVGYYHAHAPFYQNLENRLLVNIFSPELFDIRRIDNFDGSQFSAGAPAHSSEYSYLLTLPDSEIIALFSSKKLKALYLSYQVSGFIISIESIPYPIMDAVVAPPAIPDKLVIRP